MAHQLYSSKISITLPIAFVLKKIKIKTRTCFFIHQASSKLLKFCKITWSEIQQPPLLDALISLQVWQQSQKWVHTHWKSLQQREILEYKCPYVALIRHYTGVKYTVDYKWVLLKENPFPFHVVSNSTIWKRDVTRPEKENCWFTSQRARLQDQHNFTYQLEHCNQSGTNISKILNCLVRKLTGLIIMIDFIYLLIFWLHSILCVLTEQFKIILWVIIVFFSPIIFPLLCAAILALTSQGLQMQYCKPRLMNQQ